MVACDTPIYGCKARFTPVWRETGQVDRQCGKDEVEGDGEVELDTRKDQRIEIERCVPSDERQVIEFAIETGIPGRYSRNCLVSLRGESTEAVSIGSSKPRGRPIYSVHRRRRAARVQD